MFVGASPDPASMLAGPESPSSRATVKTPAPTTAAAAHAAPNNFTPRRLVGVRFAFIAKSLRAHRKVDWTASVSSLIYVPVTLFLGTCWGLANRERRGLDYPPPPGHGGPMPQDAVTPMWAPPPPPPSFWAPWLPVVWHTELNAWSVWWTAVSRRCNHLNGAVALPSQGEGSAFSPRSTAPALMTRRRWRAPL